MFSFVSLSDHVIRSCDMSLLFLRIQEFKVSLSEQKLDIKALRQLCFSGTCVCVCGESGCLSPHGYTLSLSLSLSLSGIPCEGGIRSLCWKVSLAFPRVSLIIM